MDGSWFEPVRAYCERTDAAFWSEPLNALSNGAFLIAAAASARTACGRDSAGLALAVLVGVIGLGSFLFHTLANRWSMLADVIPIGLFIYAYLALALRRFFGASAPAATALTLAFAAFNLGFAPGLDALTGRAWSEISNGSIDYGPAVLALVGVGAGLLLPPRSAGRRRAGWTLLGLALLFLVSLTARTLDAALCPRWPTGTHALWHVLNAVVLAGLIRVAVRFGAGHSDLLRDPANRCRSARRPEGDA